MLFRVSGKIASKSQFRFSTVRAQLHDLLYRDDKSSDLYKLAAGCPKSAVGQQGSEIREQERRYEVTKLSNGITVLTESASSPSRVDVGILLDVGTRDETNETSGSLLSIKNTYYKTVLNTNETINYGVIQQSGGEFEMDYDQENTYFKAHCLAHDVVDVFKVVADCALEPRSVVAANSAIEKNYGTHNLENIIKSGEGFNETIFKTAFGLAGLGMPLRGFKTNIGNLSAYTIQKFQLENINPSKIIVAGAGIYNHTEFVSLVQDSLGFIPAGQTGKVRTQTQYVGGEVRNLTDDNEIAIALLFPSANWTNSQAAVYQVLNALLGLQGSAQSRLQRNILNKNSYADVVESLNFTFSDAGLFGVKIIGSADKGSELLGSVVNELKTLTGPISNTELTRAKNILKTQLYLALERTSDRLEEAAKSLKVFNAIKLNDYASYIDAVTSDQINKAVVDLLKNRPTLVAEGGLANRLPTFDQVLNQLK
ncbi:unnamed protein product [Paramecium sonneborni]|uniref:Peptidase M16 C-terminal domain-containing protein n=1 Tax=Paramecium sonneborni TaxID=65129 RepID=A0A8S1NDL3_9CILI|nr:unnamed protein product [Paramecium sonneborni]